ncbi:heterokaryon incompatibility protein-domain-containing protein [Xylariaceae sp. FL0016]|nr:heterokaryon incompatibility protein-domain-containing protein [Xylariaceae sp. FL0016]
MRRQRTTACANCQQYLQSRFIFVRICLGVGRRRRRFRVFVTCHHRRFSPLSAFRQWPFCGLCREIWQVIRELSASYDASPLDMKWSRAGIVTAQWCSLRMPRDPQTLRERHVDELGGTAYLEFFVPLPDRMRPLWWADLCVSKTPAPRKCLAIGPYYNVDSIRAWLRYCEHHHDQCSHPTMSSGPPPGFRLIDTESLCITPTQNKITRYVALSYVWSLASSSAARASLALATENVGALSSKGSLTLSQLPEVIVDAIHFCRAVGERYLWVDRLCIVQDEPRSKGLQISAMGEIYTSALFTLVAASAADGVHGLPGTTGRDRGDAGHPGTLEDVGMGSREMRRMQDAIGMLSIIEDSPWALRGWTFQEQVLSRRLVYITETRVAVQCGRNWVEEREGRILEVKGDGQDPGGDQPSLNAVDIESIDGYYRAVELYSQRTLTFQSDILEAFKGIVQVSSARLDTEFIFGLPEKCFVRSLLWEPGQIERHLAWLPELGIPSWSWASWNSSVVFSQLPAGFKVYGSLSIFHYADGKLGPRVLDTRDSWVAAREHTGRQPGPDPADICRLFLGSDNCAEPSYVAGRARLSLSQENTAHAVNTMWLACPHNPWTAMTGSALDERVLCHVPRLRGALVFKTTVAKLFILPGSGRPNDEYHGLYTDLGERQVRVGTTALMAPTKNMDMTRPYDVAVLGGKAFFDIRAGVDGPLSESWQWTLSVIMLGAAGMEGVSQRVTVGEVSVGLWSLCNPRWETVVLL